MDPSSALSLVTDQSLLAGKMTEKMTGIVEDVSMAVAEVTGSGNGSSDAYWSKLPFSSPYWHQFDIENIPASYHYVVAVWMTFFGILGVAGNLLVVYIFSVNKKLRTPPNMLLVNLALSDMLFSAFNGFPLLTISSINKVWVWGDEWCQAYGFAGGIFGLMSINTLAAIAMDRHYVITKPLQVARTMTKKHAMVSILIVWIWSALWSSPPLFGWGGKYKPDGFQTSCTYDYVTQTTNNITFNLCMYSFSFIIPVALIFYSYIGIVREMFKHSSEMVKQAAKMGATISQSDQDKKTEFQAAKVAFITVMSFLLSWTPYAIIGICGLVFDPEEKRVTPIMSEIAVMFAKASAAYNPIIYALSHPRFRIELNKRFPLLMCCCRPDEKLARGTSSVSVASATTISTGSVNLKTLPTTQVVGGQCS